MFTRAELTILELLDKERRWWYALDLIKASEGRLRRGVIYVHLARLGEQELVESREQNDDEFHPQQPYQGRRRLYRITQSGVRKRLERGSPEPSLIPEPA